MLLFDKIVLFCMAVFFILYGIFAVTNIRVDWGPTLMGFAALILGIVCLIRGLK